MCLFIKQIKLLYFYGTKKKNPLYNERSFIGPWLHAYIDRKYVLYSEDLILNIINKKSKCNIIRIVTGRTCFISPMSIIC